MLIRNVTRSIAFASIMVLTSTSFAGIVDKVIVVVNDEVVTQREFNRVFSPIRQKYQTHFSEPELTQRIEAARKGLLEQMINSKLAISLAKKSKTKVNQEELKNRINKVKEYYPDEQAFLEALSAKGTTLTEFEDEIEDQMLAQAYIEKEVASDISIAPGEIRELYEKNKDKLLSRKEMKVRCITIRKPVDAGEAQEAKKRMEDICCELNNGKDFAALAKEKSEGPFAEQSGDMGYIYRGRMVKEIEDSIFSLDKGGKTDIVETNMGYHIFLVEDIKEPKQLEFQEVSDFLRQKLYSKQFEQKLAKWLEEKRKNAYISYK